MASDTKTLTAKRKNYERSLSVEEAAVWGREPTSEEIDSLIKYGLPTEGITTRGTATILVIRNPNRHWWSFWRSPYIVERPYG